MLRELIAYKKTLNLKRKIASQRRTALGFVHGEKHDGLSDTPQWHVATPSQGFSAVRPSCVPGSSHAQKLLLGAHEFVTRHFVHSDVVVTTKSLVI